MCEMKLQRSTWNSDVQISTSEDHPETQEFTLLEGTQVLTDFARYVVTAHNHNLGIMHQVVNSFFNFGLYILCSLSAHQLNSKKKGELNHERKKDREENETGQTPRRPRRTNQIVKRWGISNTETKKDSKRRKRPVRDRYATERGEEIKRPRTDGRERSVVVVYK